MSSSQRDSVCVTAGMLLTAILVAALMFVAFIRYVFGSADDTMFHEHLINELVDQIALLKWIGGAAITSLCATIALLFRISQRQQAVIVAEVRHVAEAKAEVVEAAERTRVAMERLATAIEHLQTQIKQCPIAVEWSKAKEEKEA